MKISIAKHPWLLLLASIVTVSQCGGGGESTGASDNNALTGGECPAANNPPKPGDSCTTADLWCNFETDAGPSDAGNGRTCTCRRPSEKGDLVWECADSNLCSAGTYDGMKCSGAGKTCEGTDQWRGWTCTCRDADGGSAWSCSEKRPDGGVYCPLSAFDGESCSTVGSSCEGDDQWQGWKCRCATSGKSTAWVCTAGVDGGTMCPLTAFSSAECFEGGSKCQGAGIWKGWSCACGAASGSKLTWTCSMRTDAGDSCQLDTYDGQRCTKTGAVCGGTGRWAGWRCTCSGVDGGQTWTCAK